MSSSHKIFSVRIVSIEYYMAPPIPGFDVSYSSFQGAKVNEVPVIRVYGSTPAGQKTCLHVHKAFPYLYIPCSNSKLDAYQEGEAFANSVSLALEKALKLKGSAGSKRQHVHGCNLVRAKKFYGYHSSEELFVKIYFYHPQDVSRAANLLLGGAVLDRSFQPHESHIPFILQFLIDYNLYGMGHMHLSKMKFRHPVPGILNMRKLSCSEHSRLGINSSSCTCSSDQTDNSAGECLDPPVWLSSTIPDGWMWHFAGNVGTSSPQEIQLVQRQSVCELEGDATVDEIINQQFKDYTSLSQACSEAKMVQSLIPIWEEEYERTGMCEPVIPPDPGKPLPHDVLKTLLNGLEFERNLRQLCCRTHDNVLPLSTDKGGLIDFEKELAASAADRKNVCAESSSAAELEISGILGKSDQNAEDTEALGILRWLAASQAGLDINSDDELVHETIMSPLLPATPIDKMLAKANMFYDSESQKECQDILDSIQDVTEVELVKEKPSTSVVQDHPSEILLEKQSSLARSLNSCCPASVGSVKVENKGESYGYSEQLLQTASKKLVNNRKRNMPSWGSLPLAQKVCPYSQNFRSCPNDMSIIKPENCVVAVTAMNDEGNCSEDIAKRVETGVHESSTLVGCSLRDLMRRKRCHRASEADNVLSSDKMTPAGEQGEDSSLVPRRLDFHDSQSDEQEKKPISFRTHWPSVTELPLELRDDTGGSNFDLMVPESRKDEDHLSNEIERRGANMSNSSSASPIKPEKFVKEFPEHQVGSDGRISGGKLFAVHDENTLDVNQPMVTPLWNIGNCYTAEFSEDEHVPVLCRSAHNMVSLGRPTVGDVKGNEVMRLDTFPDDCNAQQEGVMDVSAHYQNDGSLLYLLTPNFSPPSAETVKRWLSRDCKDTHGDVKELSQPLSMEGSSDMGTDSASVENNDALIESRPLSPHTPILGQVQHDKGQNCIQEFHSRNNEDQSRPHIQKNGVKLNIFPDCSVDLSQISGPDGRSRPTPLSQIGFRDPASVGAGQQLTLLSIEVLAETRGDLRPDPRFDPINLIALAFQCDNDSAVQVFMLLRSKMDSKKNSDGMSGCNVFVESDEKSLLARFERTIGSFDPDMLLGWNVQSGSLGFLAERAAHLGLGLLRNISRTPLGTNIGSAEVEAFDEGETETGTRELLVLSSPAVGDAVIQDEWGRTHASGVHVGGRVVLNLWRLMRAEVKLNLYAIEAVAEAVLRKKIPSIHHKVLTRWFASGTARARYRCIEYMIQRAKLNLEIMNQLDMVNRTSELARVFGIDFFSVLSRGSQYRVESMLLRLAHSQNYLAISPGSQQVASQPAMECLPLVMEPESGFYADPVVVLDFQSLYPSMIIAYNLCFSTCLGNVMPAKADTLGVCAFSLDPLVLQNLKDEMLLTPNGVMYVPSKVRKGIMPRLLEEILSTRIMVKQTMKKLASSQQVLHRILNARQLALKLIANVTYGYTAAGFSGRMPCAELADSIVQCGRCTLERAIALVNANDNWKARVIYGDTDSMFVLLKGRSIKESFQIGREIASAVTAMNPHPVTLKLEKVYQPCFLLTKKRYVGYSYENADQTEPTFDAKGIETVRRDTCGAVAKIMEQSLRLFFKHQDVSEVKSYLQRQWQRILSGRVSLQDFVFAKEVRLGTYSTRASSSLPPAAIVAAKAMKADPRAEPCYAERVPYVVIHGEPGARLVDMVVDPLDILAIDSHYRLNELYYITKQIIPALQRVFGLVGADLNLWFLEMPRPARETVAKHFSYSPNPRRTRIDYYYLSKHCVLCGELVHTSAYLCRECSHNEVAAATTLTVRTSKIESHIQHLAAICRHCGGGDWLVECGVKCTSLACSIFYERRKVQKELQSLSAVATAKGFYPKCMVELF